MLVPCRYDNLGNVSQGRQRSVNVSLPVEASAERVSSPPAKDPEEAWAEPQRVSPTPGASGTYVMEVTLAALATLPLVLSPCCLIIGRGCIRGREFS